MLEMGFESWEILFLFNREECMCVHTCVHALILSGTVYSKLRYHWKHNKHFCLPWRY